MKRHPQRERPEQPPEQPPENKNSLPVISVTSKANVVPALTKIPDQSILDKPAPEEGMTLRESWTGRLKK